MIRRALDARRVLVVAPHPDDEAIGAWGLMHRLGQAGARIEVIVVSDGAASHPESARWPCTRLVRERRRETLRAMRTLAIPPSRIRFLMLPDGGLEARLGGVAGAIARALRRRPWPDLIVGPVLADAHGDHRAVARALAGLRRRGERRLGYLVWPDGARRRGPSIAIPLGSDAMAAKRQVIRGYRTQTGRIADAKAGFTVTLRHLRMFVRPCERFRVLA